MTLFPQEHAGPSWTNGHACIWLHGPSQHATHMRGTSPSALTWEGGLSKVTVRLHTTMHRGWAADESSMSTWPCACAFVTTPHMHITHTVLFHARTVLFQGGAGFAQGCSHASCGGGGRGEREARTKQSGAPCVHLTLGGGIEAAPAARGQDIGQDIDPFNYKIRI